MANGGDCAHMSNPPRGGGHSLAFLVWTGSENPRKAVAVLRQKDHLERTRWRVSLPL
jgi:hypothetical protein